MISVLILTKNEEQDLPACIDSLWWSDDIHVYDSYSTDATLDIAKSMGAKIIQRKFDNWSEHQNWGLKNIKFKNEWVYYSDADERVTPELANSMLQFIKNSGDVVACRVRRRDYFMGHWLKHVTASPFNIRLFKPEFIRYERLTNPVTIVDGQIFDLKEHFNHFPFSKGISHWIGKHNDYSSFEAMQIIENNKKNKSVCLIDAFWASDKNIRRVGQKELFYKMPFRPLIMFFGMYVFRLGFLDGKPGLVYSLLRSIYEYFIVLKVRELESYHRVTE
jgi:glycosyltransferase involved in cell wall biosynthesis